MTGQRDAVFYPSSLAASLELWRAQQALLLECVRAFLLLPPVRSLLAESTGKMQRAALEAFDSGPFRRLDRR